MIVTVLRSAILYVTVILCMRLLGKRQVGELQPSELVVTILISELASIPMQDLNRPVTNGITAILMLVILELLLSALSLKFMPVRRILSGKPAIVINNGEIDQKMMKRLRYSIDDLLRGLREDGCFCIDDVSYAILETNGQLSVIRKKSAEPPTRSNMHIDDPDTPLPITLISDGKLQTETIKAHNISLERINNYLNNKGLRTRDIFLMTTDSGGKFLAIEKDRGI